MARFLRPGAASRYHNRGQTIFTAAAPKQRSDFVTTHNGLDDLQKEITRDYCIYKQFQWFAIKVREKPPL